MDLGCRAALAVVFGLAFLSKVWERAAWEAFTDSLPAFGLPARLPPTPAAIAIVTAELASVVLLGVLPLAGYVLTTALLLMFTGGLGLALRGGEAVSCRCFGASQRPVGPSQLLRNGLLLALAVGGMRALVKVAAESVSPEGALVALVVGGLAGVFIARWEDLAFLVGPLPGER